MKRASCFLVGGVIAAALPLADILAAEPPIPVQVIRNTMYVQEGHVGILTQSPTTALEVAGAISATTVQVGNTTQACTEALGGAMRFVAKRKRLQVCDGTAWQDL